jgi:hypothetical protein
MLLSAVSVLVVAQSSSEIPEGLMNNPVFGGVLDHVWKITREGYYVPFAWYKLFDAMRLRVV